MDWDRVRRCVIIGVVVCASCCLFSCRKQPTSSEQTRASVPAPPDLSRCTRLETRYLPSALECLFHTREDQRLLSPEELAYLRSLEVFTINDRERIEALARKVARATYMDTSTGIPHVKGIPHVAAIGRVTCYRGEQVAASFTIREFGCIETTDGEWFELKGTGLDITQFTPGVQPFTARQGCASNIRAVAGAWAPYIQFISVYPPADKWCDATLDEVLRRFGYDAGSEFAAQEERLFQCPAAGEGKCHYAMNPNCHRDSPPDTALLFETKAGWNQHGGSELFTFDNHDPKGGCVLLNDGTVKFIRTGEELKQLRWK